MSELNKPLTRMSKQELYDKLVSLGYSEEQLSDENGSPLKRPDLACKLKSHKDGDECLAALENAEEDDDVGVPVENYTDDDTDASDEQKTPTPRDSGWTQYVLGMFTDDEVDGQYPRVEGLRRIAGELVGEIVEEGCDLVSAPTEENRFRACAKAWGVFHTALGLKRFEALADAHVGNCLEDYATHLVAMADTRAKGRMFRNALCLKRVIAAEEINKTAHISGDIQSGGEIHLGQITLIRMMADRHNLSILDALSKLGIKYELSEATGDVNLKILTYEEALSVVEELRKTVEDRRTNSVG